MMNIENAKRCIAVMERVSKYPARNFDMGTWIAPTEQGLFPVTEGEAFNCGTSACFLGWLALAPDIPEIYVRSSGAIVSTSGESGSIILAHLLEISQEDAKDLCGLGIRLPGDPRYLMGKETPQDVIDAINWLIEVYTINPSKRYEDDDA